MKTLTINDWALYPNCDKIPVDGKNHQLSENIDYVPILRPLSEMTDIEASTFIEKRYEQFSMIQINKMYPDKIDATVQTRSPLNNGRKVKRTFAFITYTPEQFRWLLENNFDTFGWIEKGLAVTQTQADNATWDECVKEVEKLPEAMALYGNSVIAASQVGVPMRGTKEDTEMYPKANGFGITLDMEQRMREDAQKPLKEKDRTLLPDTMPLFGGGENYQTFLDADTDYLATE